MATISGTVEAVDSLHTGSVSGAITFGALILGIDSPHQGSAVATVIGEKSYFASDLTFVQGAQLGEDGLTLTLSDSTLRGWTLVDGTYVDGTYTRRNYDPLWLNYSIWYRELPDGSDLTLQGYRYRTPVHPSVGQYYASMMAPDNPGLYEIDWMYQKDNSSLAEIKAEHFTVSSFGVDSFPDYTYV